MVIRVVGRAVAWVLALGVTLPVLKLTAVACLMLACLVPVFLPADRRVGAFWLALAAWGVAMTVPVDVTLADAPGPPRLVPYVTGFPTRETSQRARRGEVVLGGCSVSGWEPKWVLVW